MSSKNDQLSMYHRSYSNFSSQLSAFRPWMTVHPVHVPLQPVEVPEHGAVAFREARGVRHDEPQQFEALFESVDLRDQPSDIPGLPGGADHNDARERAHGVSAVTPMNSCIVASPSPEIPSRMRTWRTVRNRIFTSSASDHWST